MSGNPGRDESGDSQNLPRLTQGQMDDLERLIDRYDLNQVLEAISDICHMKADHKRLLAKVNEQARLLREVFGPPVTDVTKHEQARDHVHDWQEVAPLIDRCTVCGEERS